jgi:hypothetical protein
MRRSVLVEAACKTLVAQRLKAERHALGMSGGQSVLTVWGWTQSERFDRAWAPLATTYPLQVTIVDNVLAFPNRHTPA